MSTGTARFCPSCGSEVVGEFPSFCASCGAKLMAEAAVPDENTDAVPVATRAHQGYGSLHGDAPNSVAGSQQKQNHLPWLIAGSGVAVFISSFLPWLRFGGGTVTISYSGTETEWSGTVMILLGVATTVVAALVALGITPQPWLRLTRGIAIGVVGLAIYKIADVSGGNGSVGLGLWLALLAGAVAAAFSVAALGRR